MRKIFALTMAILAVLLVFTFPAYAGEVTDVMEDTAPVTEAVIEAETEPVTEIGTETTSEITTEISEETESAADHTETETSGETETETETTVPFDEWLYGLMQEATPEQVEMIEVIVLGGVGALDSLGIKGFDRLRVWVEHNMATVLTILLIASLIGFFVATLLQKRGFSKKADILNSNAIEIYEKGQEAIEKANKITKEATSAMERVLAITEQEREAYTRELDRNARINAALCETVNFLLQCSDLPVSKRDEAEAIYKKAQEAMNHDHTDEA